MGYILYSTVFLLIGISTALILLRTHWLPLLPSINLPFTIPQINFPSLPSFRYSPLPSFSGDIESGLSSSNFNLTPNLTSADTRAGLDIASKKEVLKIMKKRGVGFDEARRLFVEKRFGENGIGPDGRPRDPKFVSFS